MKQFVMLCKKSITQHLILLNTKLPPPMLSLLQSAGCRQLFPLSSQPLWVLAPDGGRGLHPVGSDGGRSRAWPEPEATTPCALAAESSTQRAARSPWRVLCVHVEDGGRGASRIPSGASNH